MGVQRPIAIDEASVWTFEPNPTMPRVDVAIVDCFVAEKLCSNPDTKPDVLVSLWDKDTHASEIYPWVAAMLHSDDSLALVLEFDDVLEDKPLHGYVAPTERDVTMMLIVGSGVIVAAQMPNCNQRILFHCAAGVSRSSSFALVLFAQLLGPGGEKKAVRALLEAREKTTKRGWRDWGIKPNRTVVELADKLLHRGGKLVEAYAEVFEPPPAEA